MFRYSLEKYRGSKTRHRCPSCGRPREFTRYVDENGEYVDDTVGICNRKVKCGYHYSPSAYFSENPVRSDRRSPVSERRMKALPSAHTSRIDGKNEFDTIGIAVLRNSLAEKRPNEFLLFLQNLYGMERMAEVRERYAVGTWSDGRTVFWQIDKNGLVRTGKLMSYDGLTGKRRKDRAPSWVHAELNRRHDTVTPERDRYTEYSLRQCTFGEHLVTIERHKPIAVVESEKTAVIASIHFPGRIWLATGGCSNLRLADIVRSARGRPIKLFPDSSQFENWSRMARRYAGNGIQISKLLDERLSEDEKASDMDIADVILGLGTHE